MFLLIENCKVHSIIRNVLYLKHTQSKNVLVLGQQKGIVNTDYMIIKNLSKRSNYNQISKLTWSIVRLASADSNISKMCLLRVHEKLLILTYYNLAELLNKR